MSSSNTYAERLAAAQAPENSVFGDAMTMLVRHGKLGKRLVHPGQRALPALLATELFAIDTPMRPDYATDEAFIVSAIQVGIEPAAAFEDLPYEYLRLAQAGEVSLEDAAKRLGSVLSSVFVRGVTLGTRENDIIRNRADNAHGGAVSVGDEVLWARPLTSLVNRGVADGVVRVRRYDSPKVSYGVGGNSFDWDAQSRIDIADARARHNLVGAVGGMLLSVTLNPQPASQLV